MKIIKITDEIEMDKRCYLPGVIIKASCPTCKKTITEDLGENYLSYPTTNKEESVYLYCSDCDTEIKKKIILRISVEVLEE